MVAMTMTGWHLIVRSNAYVQRQRIHVLRSAPYAAVRFGFLNLTSSAVSSKYSLVVMRRLISPDPWE
jgi:hypothetical protein